MALLLPLLLAVAALLLLLLLLAALSCVRYGTWRRKGVPHPRPLPLFGNCMRFVLQREPLWRVLDRLYRQFPGEPFVGFYAGSSPVLLVKSLDAVKHITVKDFHVFTNHKVSPDPHYDKLFSKFLFCLLDDQWKTTRVKMTPSFSSGRLKAMYPSVQAVSRQLVQNISNNVDSNGVLAARGMSSRFGLDLIASCAFGCEAGALRHLDPSPYMRAVSAAFNFGVLDGFASFAMMFEPLLYHLLRRPLLKEWRTSVLRELLRQSSEHREQRPLANKDIFDNLLSLKRSGDVPYDVFEAQVMSMQMAGSETTAGTLTFALWELARNQHCQQRLRQELRASASGELTYEVLPDLKYLDMVFKETLRLWPVMAWMDRVASEDYQVPGTDLKIDKGTVVMISSFSIHRDPEHFENPEVFNPERFATAGAESSKLLAFGSGPRACIGKRFADMSVKSALANVILNFRVSMADDTPKSLEELRSVPTNFLIAPLTELPLRFEPCER